MSSRISGGSDPAIAETAAEQRLPQWWLVAWRGTGFLCMGMDNGGVNWGTNSRRHWRNLACFHCFSFVVSILRLCTCACVFMWSLMSCMRINKYRVLRCIGNLFLETYALYMCTLALVRQLFRSRLVFHLSSEEVSQSVLMYKAHASLLHRVDQLKPKMLFAHTCT